MTDKIQFSAKKEELLAAAMEFARLSDDLNERHIRLRANAAAGLDIVDETKELLAADAYVRDLKVKLDRLSRETDERLS